MIDDVGQITYIWGGIGYFNPIVNIVGYDTIHAVDRLQDIPYP